MKLGTAFRKMLPFAGRKSGMTTPELFEVMLRGQESASGVYINALTARRVMAVLACVRVVSEDIAKVPFKLFKQDGRNVNAAKDHPSYDILASRPNGWQTSFEFREIIVASAMLSGNGYAYKVRGRKGQLLEMLPMPSDCVTVRRPAGKWELRYTIALPNGGGTLECGQADMFHLRGPSIDGVLGTDIVQLARDSIGLAASAEQYQSRMARGSLKAAGVLQTDQNLTEEQVKELSRLWSEEYGGAANADKTPVLVGGLKFETIAATGKDNETLDTRRFQVEDIARAFRVFPAMIGFSDKAATHASASEFFIAHVVHTLQPWAARFEQAIERDVLSKNEVQQGYFVKLMLNGLLRGDIAARGQFYKDLTTCGAITRNEIRGFEDMNPIDGLDEPLHPVNLGLDGSLSDPSPVAPAAEDKLNVAN